MSRPSIPARAGASADPAGSSLAAPLSGPALANGRYELREFISKGGMGAVYRAWDVELDRWVAVKCILDAARKGSRGLALKEAKTLASLNHPNIMRIYDVLSGDDKNDDNEQVWLVSEWLEGKSLAQLPLPLPPAAVLAIMAQVYDALAASHAAQIIHRDVKPSNVIIGDNGRVFLIDFGVAFAPGLSTGETVVGSLRYADPRTLEGNQPDVNTDLFSAALLQIELMTGETVLPDLAPLPLYRHIRKHLGHRLDALLDGTYPPLAVLARRYTGEMLEALNHPRKASVFSNGFAASHSAAREAALIAQDQLRKLTGKTADQYLALYLGNSDAKVLEIETIIADETSTAIASELLTPRQKAAWVAFQSHKQPQLASSHHDDSAHKKEEDHEITAASLSDAPRRLARSKVFNASVAISSALVILSLLLWMKLTIHERTDRDASTAEDSRSNAMVIANGTAIQNASSLSSDKSLLSQPIAPALTDDASNTGRAEKSGADTQKTAATSLVPVHIAANAWAIVSIDGREIGRLPQAAPFSLPPGNHKLRLENPVVEPLETTIEVSTKEPNRLRFNLNPKTTPRVIKLSRPGRLYVDGVDHGVVTTKALPLAYGTHEFWIKRDDKIIKLQNIPIGPDSPLEISIKDE